MSIAFVYLDAGRTWSSTIPIYQCELWVWAGRAYAFIFSGKLMKAWLEISFEVRWRNKTSSRCMYVSYCFHWCISPQGVSIWA